MITSGKVPRSNREPLNTHIFLATVLLLSYFSNRSAAETDVSFAGYVKSFAIAQQAFEIDNLPGSIDDFHTLFQSQNTLRITADAFTGNTVAWQLHYEITPIFFSSTTDSNPFGSNTIESGGNSYRLSDINETLGNPSSSKQLTYQNLDRFNAQFNLESGDLTIGRQVISLGSARIINPTDVFFPFKPTTLNQEYRTGIDMIRFQKPMGNLSELDMGIVLGADAKPENSAAFLSYKNHWRSSDVATTFIHFAEYNLMSIGIESSVGNMGTWFETAWVSGDESYNRTSLGVDYSLSTNIFGQIEYHYNGAGKSDSSHYEDLADHIGYQKGGVFLLGRHYLMPSVSWTATPLLSLSLSSIINVDDSSAFINIVGAYSLGDDVGIDLGMYLFHGKKLEFAPETQNLIVNSEYGSNADLLYLSLRYYF